MNKFLKYLKLMGNSESTRLAFEIEQLKKNNCIQFAPRYVVLDGCFDTEELETIIKYMRKIK